MLLCIRKFMYDSYGSNYQIYRAHGSIFPILFTMQCYNTKGAPDWRVSLKLAFKILKKKKKGAVMTGGLVNWSQLVCEL